MLFNFISLLSAASLVSGASIPREDPDVLIARQDSGDPPFQQIPTTAKADNTFNNGKAEVAGISSTNEMPPAVYGNRSIDIPFGRLYHGNMKFFSTGQLNTAGGDTDQWYPQGTDSATQSACGIPDNAFTISKVAIHPYFLKYADLSRYCMQDVCISFWKEDGSSDMMLKVTDICSTDPNDPTHCATPGDIKIDRTKAKIMEKLDSVPEGDEYPETIWWFFMKCWDDGLVQPAYADNWFAQPPLPCNLDWAQATQHQQWVNNQQSYPNHNPPLPLYPNGAYDPKRDNTTSPPIEDFDPNETYNWTPVAGGKGWGNPSGKASGTSTNSEGSSGTQNSGQASGKPSGQASTQEGSQGNSQGSSHGSGQPGGTILTTPSNADSGSGSGQTGGTILTNPSNDVSGSEEEACDE